MNWKLPQNGWKYFFDQDQQQQILSQIDINLKEREAEREIIFPNADVIFRAFELCDLPLTKVVIIGQDPYHGEKEANGLSFSVNDGIKTPPSLRNIFKEINTSCPKYDINRSTDLADWAQQGVLLINTVLTVAKDKAASHRSVGWQKITHAAIREVSASSRHVVFMLLGKDAQAMKPLIDQNKHTILESSHPSPLSSYRGFFGSHIFKQCNDALIKHQQQAINW